MHETNKAEVLARLGSWGKAARHFVAGMLLGLAPLSGFSQVAFQSNVIDRQGLVWTTGGDANWRLDETTTLDRRGGRSGAISDRQSSWTRTTVSGPASIEFSWKTSTEEAYDRLSFKINGQLVAVQSGERDWAVVKYEIHQTGDHVLEFEYSKDFRDSTGSDSVWVDNLVVIPGGNVLSKDDTIVATSANSPLGENAARAIDGAINSKYLNFDKVNTGFTVTPKAGASVISAMTIITANDAPERDPATWQILGSNDGTTFEAIASGSLAANPTRFNTTTLAFSNTKSYTSYKVVFPTVVDAAKANSMQVAEVALHGTASGGGAAPRFTGIKANADGTVTITWTGAGVLQSANSLSGPWTDVAGATSPLTVPANQAAQFARIRK